MTTTPWTKADDALALCHAHRLAERADVEVRLLACIAPCGRWGLALAERHGVTLAHFAADDTRALYMALAVAHAPRDRRGPAERRNVAFGLAIAALEAEALYDATDERPFVAGLRWGPGPISALFTRLPAAMAEREIPGLAARLVALGAMEVAA